MSKKEARIGDIINHHAPTMSTFETVTIELIRADFAELVARYAEAEIPHGSRSFPACGRSGEYILKSVF
jgi:hypothetical protein